MVEMKEKLEKKMEDLEALPVDNAGAGLVVLLLGDPHLLEGGQGSQDRATDPDGVLPLGRGNNLDEKGEGESRSVKCHCVIFTSSFIVRNYHHQKFHFRLNCKVVKLFCHHRIP